MTEIKDRPRGKASHGSASQRMAVRVPAELAAEIKETAQRADCSVSAVMIYLIRRGLQAK